MGKQKVQSLLTGSGIGTEKERADVDDAREHCRLVGKGIEKMVENLSKRVWSA